MVNATVDNEAISITLKNSESTTVPTGEVWKVTISTVSNERVRINGERLISSYTGGGEPNVSTVETVITGGDTVAHEGTETYTAVHIGGFVVNS